MKALDSKSRAFVARDLATIVDTRSEKDAAGEWRPIECVIALVTVAKIGARIRCEVRPGEFHGREFRPVGGRWVGYGSTNGYLRERRPGDGAALKVAALRDKRKEAEYQRAGLAREAEALRESATRRMDEAAAVGLRAAGLAATVEGLDAEIAALEKEASDG